MIETSAIEASAVANDGVHTPHAPSDEAPSASASVGAELTRYLPHLQRMSGQLQQTATQIETAVVGVCGNFQDIALRARETVKRTSSILGAENRSGGPSFEDLIRDCSNTLVQVLNTTEEAGQISRRAIERIEHIDLVSEDISRALMQLDLIANGNRVLAINARIEAAHAGSHGAGFAVVAAEVVSQTERSQQLTAEVSSSIEKLRTLARSAVVDLRQMTMQDAERLEQRKRQVDESLRNLRTAHAEMEHMLSSVTTDGASLADDIGAAVRGLQFQDRTNQRIAHVIEDLDTLRTRLEDRFGKAVESETVSFEGFSEYTMQEEREVAGMHGTEAAQGEVELF